MEDTDSYILYYRKVGDTSFEEVRLTSNSYLIEGLLEDTDYQIQIAGVNKIGVGPKSNIYTCRTTNLEPPKTYNYGLINTVVEGAEKTAHIQSVRESGVASESQWNVVDRRL